MSESEYERLYQEFVRRGGGTYTLDGTNKTPLEYYETVTGAGLTPEEQARLDADQEQYNRQQALNTISEEIANNNFTNPFDVINELGRNAYAQMANDPIINAVGALNAAINGHEGKDAIIQYLIDNGYGSMWLTVDSLPTLTNSLYDQLQTHTDSQVANLPETMEQVSQAVAMAQQFEDRINFANTQSCNLFNELLGLLSGAYDGMLNFIKDAVKPIIDFFKPYADVINNMISAITGTIDQVLAELDNILSPIKDAFSKAMNFVNDLVSQVTGFVDDLFNQISNEVAGLLNMANEMLNRAKALALAAAAFDVCQLAVLLRTGSNNLTNAIGNLTAPLPTVAPTVPTEVDPRANPAEVAAQMSAAQRDAATAQGVPQSPLRQTVRPYDPISSYFSRITSGITGALSDAVSTIRSAAGIPIASSVSTLPRNPSSQSVNQSGTDTAQVSGTTAVRSRAFERFVETHVNDLLEAKNNLRRLRIEIRAEFDRTDVQYTVAQKGQSRTYIETLITAENSLTQKMNGYTASMTYTSEGGRRDEIKEAAIESRYNEMSNSALNAVISANRRVREISAWFNSVKI